MQIEITNDQITKTLDAEVMISDWNRDECELGEDSWNYRESKVSGVNDTIAEFVAANGEPSETVALDRIQPGLLGYRWESVQSAPGKRRGDLTVVDFGNVRTAIFDGEI
jgi:hypothetical protein